MPGQIHPMKASEQLRILAQIEAAFSVPRPWSSPPAPGDLEDFPVEE